MIITADSITLSFFVVASVVLTVVVVLVWYIYSSRKFRDNIIKMMDEKLETYLDNLEPPKKEELAEQTEVAEELPQSFVEKDLSHSIEEISKFPDKPQ